jgi:hypothetical protein
MEMADTTTAPPPAAPAKRNWLFWIRRGLAVFSIIVGSIVILAKLAEPFVLPNCNSKRAHDTLRNIFKEKNLPDPTLTDTKEITHTTDEKTCEAAFVIPDEKGVVDYRIYWKEKDVQVMITRVRS